MLLLLLLFEGFMRSFFFSEVDANLFVCLTVTLVAVVAKHKLCRHLAGSKRFKCWLCVASCWTTAHYVYEACTLLATHTIFLLQMLCCCCSGCYSCYFLSTWPENVSCSCRNRGVDIFLVGIVSSRPRAMLITLMTLMKNFWLMWWQKLYAVIRHKQNSAKEEREEQCPCKGFARHMHI